LLCFKLTIFLEYILLTQPPNNPYTDLLANLLLRDYIILGKGLRPYVAKESVWALRVHLGSLVGRD